MGAFNVKTVSVPTGMATKLLDFTGLVGGPRKIHLRLQVDTSGGNVRIGDSTITATSGYPVSSLAEFEREFTVSAGDALYAISSGSSAYSVSYFTEG